MTFSQKQFFSCFSGNCRSGKATSSTWRGRLITTGTRVNTTEESASSPTTTSRWATSSFHARRTRGSLARAVCYLRSWSLIDFRQPGEICWVSFSLKIATFYNRPCKSMRPFFQQFSVRPPYLFELVSHFHITYAVLLLQIVTSLETATAIALKKEGTAVAKFNFNAQTNVELSLKKGNRYNDLLSCRYFSRKQNSLKSYGQHLW